jgi:hypothetical protein
MVMGSAAAVLAATVLAVMGVALQGAQRNLLLSQAQITPPPHTQGLSWEDESEGVVAYRMSQYSLTHPVYNRCAKVANLEAFSDAITKSCGNVHELETCSWACTSVMEEWSSKMGCCFETVLEAYKFASPRAEHAWRMWQGTMSGKCGVTFDEKSCGEAVGEHAYKALKSRVGELEDVAKENENDLEYLASYMFYNNNNNGYDDYGYNDYDPNDNYYEDNYMYPDDGYMVPPTHYAKHALPMKAAHPGPANGKRFLGDEVWDMPAVPGQDMGDVHVPADKIAPYSYVHGHGKRPKRVSGNRIMHGVKAQSLAQKRPGRTQALSNAYDDSINYMNVLRIKEGMRGKRPSPDPTAPHFGEAWQGRAQGMMSDEIAAIAPPTPGEAWQGKARQPLESLQQLQQPESLQQLQQPESLQQLQQPEGRGLQSLEEKRGLMPAQLPFEARGDEERVEEEPGDRLSEEGDVAFPMARGVIIGGDGYQMGIGRPAAAGVDPVASPREGPIYKDVNGDGHNRLTPQAAIREARFENNWDNMESHDGEHPFAHAVSGDASAVPRKDAGTKALEAAGVRVE